MVALTPRQGMNVPLAPLIAAVVAGLLLLAIGIAPTDLIERVVVASGLPALVPAAGPPLGTTARLALLFLAGCGIAGIGWATMRLGLGARFVGRGEGEEVEQFNIPAIRRADAHPDAPARAPVRAARDLGEPVIADFTVADPPRAIPDDLETTLAAYDPAAVPAVPLTIDRPMPLRSGERIETFELTPASRPSPIAPPHVDIEPIAAPETEATIHALLARLERGVARRRRSPAPPQVHAALDTLRTAVGA